MKEKAKEAASKMTTKRGLMATLMALALVGGGSAAVIDYFAQTSGSGTVDSQAITNSSSTSFSHTASAPHEVFVDTLDLTNNNAEAYEEVSFMTTVTEGASVDGQSVSVQDVEGTHEVTTQSGVTIEIGYDEADDEVTFTPTAVTNYSSMKGVVFGFDTDEDGNYDFQLDSVSSGAQPDYYGYDDQSTGKGDFTDSHDYTQDNSEHAGVYFQDTATQLQDKDSFTLTVDADRLGSSFAIDAEQDGSTFLDDNWDGSTTESETPGQEVTGSEDLVAGDSTRTYAIFTELAADADSGTYNTSVDFTPVAN